MEIEWIEWKKEAIFLSLASENLNRCPWHMVPAGNGQLDL